MLYLHPPYYMFEGVPVVGDYHDERQFYYFPNAPHLAADDQGRPAIRFIVFREDLDEISEDEESSVGFFVFDTSLAWPEDTIKKVARKIEQDLELDAPPRLAPIPIKSGTVRVAFLDRVTEPPSAEPEPEDEEEPEEVERWVPFLEASGIPSLYGENRAIFSAMLSKKATSLLLGAFEGFMPIGVIYDLTFVGMQRAFNVHVEADWEQAYHYLREGFSLDLIFYKSEVESIVEELEDEQIIKIEASLEGVGGEAMEAEFNSVRKELQEFVLEKFFEPTVNPNRPSESDLEEVGDDLIGGARTLRNVVSGWPDAGYSRVELDITEIRRLDIDYTMARAVERKIAPQAHISLFFEDHELTRDQVVTVVDGKDALWEEVEFDVSVNVDFEADGIHGVSTDIYYGLPFEEEPEELPATWSFLFNSQLDRVKRAAWYNPEVGNHLRYRYTVHFAPDSIPGPEEAVSSGWRDYDGHLLVLSPAELYQKREVEVQLARNFPFERISQVHVHLRYEDGETGWTHEDSELLDAESPRMLMAFRTREDASSEVDYRFTFLRADGKREERGWQSTSGDLILVEDPNPDELKVRVLVAGDRSKIANLIVDFKYEDPENQVLETYSILIDQENISQVHLWTVQLQNPTKRRYRYSQTLIDTDGNVIQTGWMQEEKTTLAVGVVYVKLMEVQPELVGPPLASNGVEKIKLHLQYEDSLHDHFAEKQMEFSVPGKGDLWKLQLKDASAREYSYEVIYVLNTGFERKVGPLTSRDTFLVISSIPPQE